MVETTLSKSARANGKKLDKLRLIVAEAIFCYAVNRDSALKHIWLTAASHELYEQYCLKICLCWLATRYGFPIYTSGINTSSHAGPQALMSWEILANRYPLDTPESLELPDNIWNIAFAYLDANFEPQLELVGQLYMRTLSSQLSLNEDGKARIVKPQKDAGRIRGEFYTPSWLVNYCVGLAFDSKTPQRLLDPACGSGNFLLGALRMAATTLSAEQLLNFTSSSLYGQDIDARATSLARFSLLIQLSAQLKITDDLQIKIPSICADLDRHIRVTDALVPMPALQGSFDVVVGNPPYVSFGARNQPSIGAGWSQYLRTTYRAAAEYKIRIHSIFQQVSLELARADGQVVLLVPDAFLNGAYYKKLRQYVLANANIVTLGELPESTFDDAVVGKWCVAHYRRKQTEAKPALPTNLQRLSYSNDKLQIENYKLDPGDLISGDKDRLQIVFCDQDRNILRQVAPLAPLRGLMRGHTGIRARSGQKTIIASKAGSEKWRRGIISGASVNQHSTLWTEHWLNTDPQNLFSGGFDPAIVERDKILVRQTADRIIAAVDTEHLYHLNNVHSFNLIDGSGSGDQLYTIAGLMNSSFWLYLYQLKSRERRRALAQIDIEMIESMPLPALDPAQTKDIADLVRQIMQAKNSPDRVNALALQRTVDQYIYAAYGLSSATILHIETALMDCGYLKETLTVAAGSRN